MPTASHAGSLLSSCSIIAMDIASMKDVPEIEAVEVKVNPLEDEKSEEHRVMTKRILRKLDCYVLPPLALLWLANFLDRTNVGNAKIAGLSTDTHLTGDQFNTALAVFYVTYIAAELPSNWVLQRFKANRWLPFIVSAWGLVTTLSGLVQNFGGLVAIRLVLGLCEGGVLPGMILYLSTMYERSELQFRVGIFYASASLSGAFGGLLATAIIKLDGTAGLAGWRWIFILEGIATILVGLASAMILPADLATARFFTTEEREFARAVRRFRISNAAATNVPLSEAARRIPVNLNIDTEKIGEVQNEVSVVEADRQAINQEEERFEWREVTRGLWDPQVYFTGFAYLGLIVGLYSYSLFLPTIIAGLGFSGGAAQLHTVPPYVPAVVLTVLVAYVSDRLRWRGPFILICLPISIAGYVLAIKADNNTARYAAVFLMAAGVYPSAPCILSILPNNSSGHYKKATTTAWQLMIANTGGFIATFIYTPDQAPRYIRGHTIALSFVCLAWVLVLCNVLYCIWENKARREGRRDVNIDKYQELWDTGKTRAPIGDRSPDFRFVL